MSIRIPAFTLRPVLLAAGLGLAAMGGAIAGDGVGDRPHRDPAARMAEHLALDAAQKASVEAIFERNRPAHRKLRERGKSHWEAMRALKPGSPDYDARARALADEAGTLARDRVLARARLDAELARVLTSAQLEKFQAGKGRPGGPQGRWHHRHGGEHGDAPPSPEAKS
jgi:Spy/CpxP family protein refolding chaperone